MFREYMQSMGRGVLARPNSQRYLGALGIWMDAYYEAALDAVRARYASIATIDAVASIGRSCRIYRAPSEPEAAFRARVLNRWSSSQLRATDNGLLADLAAAGMTNCTIKRQWSRYTTGGARDAGNDRWARRWVSLIVDQPHTFGTTYSAFYGDGHKYADNFTWGATSQDTNYIIWLMRYHRALISPWKELIVILNGSIDAGGEPVGSSQIVNVQAMALTDPSQIEFPRYGVTGVV